MKLDACDVISMLKINYTIALHGISVLHALNIVVKLENSRVLSEKTLNLASTMRTL